LRIKQKMETSEIVDTFAETFMVMEEEDYPVSVISWIELFGIKRIYQKGIGKEHLIKTQSIFYKGWSMPRRE
jgi:hypothetical protein